MSDDLLIEIKENLCLLTINRVSKLNAFDDHLLIQMYNAYHDAIQNPKVRVIVLKAEGKHFSSGADVEWMQRMAHFTVAENLRDAKLLANLMHIIYHCPKPTIVMIQGKAYGGGVGLVAVCDIAIAATTAQFCFSEVQLGIIPAVISPFVIKAIGERSARALFMSAELFDAPRALALKLVHHCVEEEKLLDFTLNYAKKITNNAPLSVLASKKLVAEVANKPIDNELAYYTTSLIAHKRVSTEGQKGLNAFLNKEKPTWD